MALCTCYKCGAYPGHTNRVLDVLKLIRCSDCGTVACVHHRGGMLGGKCAECESTRSTIAAFKKGGSAAKSNEQGKVSSGLGGGGVASPDAAAIGLSSSQLQNMQSARSKAMQEGQARLAALNAQAEERSLTEEEKKRKAKIEAELAELFGDKNYVKAAIAVELIPEEKNTEQFNNLKKSTLSLGIGNSGGKSGAKGGLSGLKQSTTILSAAINNANIASQVNDIMSSDCFNDGTAGLNFCENSSLKNVSANSMVSTETIDDKKEQSVLEKNKKSTVKKITLLDSFNVKSNYRVKIEDAISLKKQSSDQIIKFLSDEFNIKENKIKLRLKVNHFIPLDNIDHLLNLHSDDLAKEDINIITGVLAQKLTFDTVFYIDQFAVILPQKNYIKGIYASFANNPEYSYDEQKNINLQLLDIAQENDKTVYLGLDNSPIKYWQEIFQEYDLSEISFVYTEVIKDEETLEFVKENNIKILIRPDVDFKYYAKILADYKNFCFGSAFERIVESNDDKVANSAILGNILKNMYNINSEFIESLLNLED